MISVMRNNLKDNGMTYIVWVALASMLLGSVMPLFFGNKSKELWALRVNEQEIDYKTFMRTLAQNQRYVAAIRAQYGQIADYLLASNGMNDVYAFTHQRLVTQALIDQVLHKSGIQLNGDYIQEKLHDMRFAQQYLADILPPHAMRSDGTIDNRLLFEFLHQQGLKYHNFEELVENRVSQWFMQNLFKTYAYTPDYVKSYEAKQELSKKGFSYVRFDHDYFLKDAKKEAITDEQAHTFFNAHTSLYRVPEKRSGVQWVFDAKNYEIAISENEVEDFYERTKNQRYVNDKATMQVRQITAQFANEQEKQAQFKKMTDLHKELMVSPAAFQDKARELSDDAPSAAQGGLIPAFSRGQKDAAFDRASFILKNDGDISPVIELKDSFVIVQRVNKKQQTYKLLQDVAGSIRTELSKKRFATYFKEDATNALQGNAIESFVKKATKEVLTGIARADRVPVAQRLFTLKEGGYDVFVEGNKGYIVRLDSIAKAYTPEFADIKKTVIEDMYAEKAQQALDRQLSRVRASMAAGTPLADSLKKEGVTFGVQKIEPFSSNDTEAVSAVRQKKLDSRGLLELEKVGSVTVQVDGDDSLLIQLDTIQEKESSAQQKNVLTSQKLAQGENAFLGALIASLYRRATIETNDVLSMIKEDNSI